MARTANIMTRIEPEIKERAEAVLDQLGISMSTAMALYLKQIALQRKIPFEISTREARHFKNPHESVAELYLAHVLLLKYFLVSLRKIYTR